MEESELYSVLGEEGFRRLVGAFYAQVPHDDILGRLYPADDMAGAEERLRNFSSFASAGRSITLSSEAIRVCACVMRRFR